jgi:uncharacterized coiled-coil protein SlyX
VKKIRGEEDFCVLLSLLNPKKCLSAQKAPIVNSVSHTLQLIDLPLMIDDSVLFELKSKGNQIFKWRSKLYGNIKSNGNRLLVYHNLEYSFDDSEEMYLIHKIAHPNNSIFDKFTNFAAEKETNVVPSNLTYKDFDKSGSNKQEKWSFNNLDVKMQKKEKKETDRINRKIEKLNNRMTKGGKINEKRNKKLDRLEKRLDDVQNNPKQAFTNSKTTDLTHKNNRDFSPGEIKLLEELTDRNKLC